ncbi:MAG: phosphate acyltransferase PlsX [Holosporaceae bacterium]|jgi:glycerol-3-phosphate acyltransferase PlsX|nr:phosphate acyltransferase PlsX [Holosporaceae bacterium]
MSASKVIAIDGMGGDNAPEAVMKGLARFAASGYYFIIFGDKSRLETLQIPDDISHEIRHTEVVVTSDMEVMSALRLGKKSSMGLAIQSVASGEAQAVISSGNTGLYMALAKIILKTVEGIDRPAIASVIPGKNGRAVCLDLGANSESDVKNMVDFAIMGEALARSIFHKENVKVALLNIGSEEVKGSRLVKKTSEILKKFLDSYVGFVEGDDFGKGDVDVIVTDGFTGNVALKTIEGTAKYIVSELKSALGSSLLAKIGAFLAMSSLSKLKDTMDPRLYNGAILVGLRGVVVKSHGNSDEIGFANAVRFTMDILNNNIFDRISEQLEKSKLHYLEEGINQ